MVEIPEGHAVRRACGGRLGNESPLGVGKENGENSAANDEVLASVAIEVTGDGGSRFEHLEPVLRRERAVILPQENDYATAPAVIRGRVCRYIEVVVPAEVTCHEGDPTRTGLAQPI